MSGAAGHCRALGSASERFASLIGASVCFLSPFFFFVGASTPGIRADLLALALALTPTVTPSLAFALALTLALGVSDLRIGARRVSPWHQPPPSSPLLTPQSMSCLIGACATSPYYHGMDLRVDGTVEIQRRCSVFGRCIGLAIGHVQATLVVPISACADLPSFDWEPAASCQLPVAVPSTHRGRAPDCMAPDCMARDGHLRDGWSLLYARTPLPRPGQNMML